MQRDKSGEHCKTSCKERDMPKKNRKLNGDDYDEDLEKEFVEMSDDKFKASLLKRRIVLLTGDITVQKVGEIKGSLIELSIASPEENIILFINSKGGEVEPGLALYDFMTLFLKASVVGVVGAECDSTALFILLGCIKRVGAPHSTFLIHPIRSEDSRIAYSPTIDNQMGYIKKTLEEYFRKGNKILEKHSKMSLKDIERLSFANKEIGTIFSAKEALKKGLIDEIAEGDNYKIF